MPDPDFHTQELYSQAATTAAANAIFAAADAFLDGARPVFSPQELAGMVSPLPDRTPPNPSSLKLPPPGITNSANTPSQQPVPLAVNGTVSACCLVADNIIFAFTTTGYIYKVIGNPFSIDLLYSP